MNWTPLGNRVLVKTEAGADKSAGGILLPDEAKRKPQRGTVVAVGPGELRKTDTGLPNDARTHWPMSVQVGDTVLFARYAGADVGDLDELKDHVLLSEQDIVARLKR